MPVNEATPDPYEVHKPEPLVGVYNVVTNQRAVRDWLYATDQEHVVPFANMYGGVSEDVDDRICNAAIYRPQERFKHPEVLHYATGYFNYDFTKQLIPGNTEAHWKPLLEDERARHVDEGTQLWLGMIAHIGGDLHRTVYQLKETGFSERVLEEYTSHDYGLVNDLLEDRAKAEIHKFVMPKYNKEGIDTTKPNKRSARHVKAARLVVAHTAMTVIKGGREVALNDYYRLKAAKSEDEREFIVQRSQQRTARVANAFLSLSYSLHHTPLVGSRFSALTEIRKAAA